MTEVGTESTIAVTVNGSRHEVPAGLTVDGLLRRLGRDPAVPGFAVAIGDRVIRRAAWGETAVEAGDAVEVVTAAQGG